MPESRSRKRRKRSRKFKFLVALVVIGAIGGLVYFNLKKEKPPETFATVEAERGRLVDKLAETGSIELVRTVEVKSTISGEISRLLVEAGEWVEKDQLMALIEPDPNQSLQLYQKRSAVERGRIDLREQEKDFERTRALFERRMLPEKDFEEAEVRLSRARSNLRLAELELEILETKANLIVGKQADELDEVRVLAPIGGIVIRRDVEIGEVVASGLSAFSGGTLLFEIGDPSQMIVRGDIAEVDIAKLRVGQEVEIVVDAYPDTTYRGQVRWIAPVGQKKQGSPIVTFDTEIDIMDREPRLRQGMSCDIDVIFSRRDSALFLPVEAVLEVFDDQQEEEGEEVKGRRGRFVAYAVRPAAADTAAGDSTLAGDAGGQRPVADTLSETSGEGGSGADSTVVADAAADTAAGDSTLAGDAGGQRPVADTLSETSGEGGSGADSTVVADAAAVTDTAAADSAAAQKPEKPPEARLDDFVEVELEIGLETSTRVEIMAGLEAGERVAADPEQVRRKKEEQAKAPEKAEKEGWF